MRAPEIMNKAVGGLGAAENTERGGRLLKARFGAPVVTESPKHSEGMARFQTSNGVLDPRPVKAANVLGKRREKRNQARRNEFGPVPWEKNGGELLTKISLKLEFPTLAHGIRDGQKGSVHSLLELCVVLEIGEAFHRVGHVFTNRFRPPPGGASFATAVVGEPQFA
eukprot:9489853-Pyramimonas_sp.AAC.1